MTQSIGANAGRLFVGEHVEDAGGAADPLVKRGAVVRPKLVAEFIEDAAEGSMREFTVLLRDQRTVSVRGCGLKCVANSDQPGDLGSYAIFTREGGGEVIVALFRVGDVAGIFEGDLAPTRKSA